MGRDEGIAVNVEGKMTGGRDGDRTGEVDGIVSSSNVDLPVSLDPPTNP